MQYDRVNDRIVDISEGGWKGWFFISQVHRQNHTFNQQQFRTLVSAYRVGMLALETLARRVHDDRPQAKYARNPPYGEDVKFLLRVAKRLGTQYMHQLCICAVNSIVSPFVLHHVALEAAQYLARNNPALIVQHLRSALLAPLVHKCQQMLVYRYFIEQKYKLNRKERRSRWFDFWIERHSNDKLYVPLFQVYPMHASKIISLDSCRLRGIR